MFLEQLCELIKLMATSLLYDSRATATMDDQQVFFHTGRVGIYQEVGSQNLHFFAETFGPGEKEKTWEVPLLEQGRQGTINIGEHRLIVLSPDQSKGIEIDL